MKHLGADERAFFSLISQAVIANPFSEERARLDLEISGLFPGVSYEERLNRTIAEVVRRTDRFEAGGQADIRLYSGEDRRLVEHAFLFDAFHRFLQPFDAFISKQISAGDTSLKVPFAGETLSLLHRRGFSPDRACRFFALFFQLRRAFFFIDHSLVGRSESMKQLRRKLWNNVFTHDIDIYDRYLWNRMEDFSTLLLGETGTGKGTAAAAIGRSGYIPFDEKKGCFAESFCRSFVELNLSEFSESLIESELFGHKKGAFTGAIENYRGVFDRCSPYGAILLDEIGEVTRPVQIKLLRVLQERRFCPVGSHEMRRFPGRVIAATNRSMTELREGGILRDDFFYRLCSDVITVPPLRTRIREDPAELDELLALTVARMLGDPSPEVAERVKKEIERHPGRTYPWPGNVRELEQCVRQILLNRAWTPRTAAGQPEPVADLMEGFEEGRLNARTLMSGYCKMLYDRLGTFEAVARRTQIDRRTVKKYIGMRDEKERLVNRVRKQ
ncbi:sigma-54-dependent Fis family transcriptional re gulator [Desulfonema ishimotonii]|uniref:Sigma-54-dependent Fis family transcriptional re gulator n=1 Tax=Desulfonema ishimotonii TaxID=45657 RepID=A0A401FZQ0_9BACT|nr:sigma 54-interacting transcriptional regulator [Desulfonema ishimotonii]GBC62416.1 sigma-54-dependent Fis family transcriptional re gulator [Desulfonema ishimotonii]